MYSRGVPRRRPPDRFDTICDAAQATFLDDGYGSAQMRRIADRADVSVGTLYLYAEGKAALFGLVVDRLTGAAPPVDLPVPEPHEETTVASVRRRLQHSIRFPRLRTALRAPDTTDPRAELGGVVDELYDVLQRNWTLLALIERSAADWPRLHETYFGGERPKLFTGLERYLTRRIEAGRFRPVADVTVAARFVTESVTWFAWKRQRDEVGAGYDEERVRRVVRGLLVDALVPAQS